MPGMPLPLNATFQNPNDYGQAYQSAADFYNQLMQGPQGAPTMQMRQYAMNAANQLNQQIGPAYDDSWMRGWLGYNDPNLSNNLAMQQLQMEYAKQRAQSRGGEIDQSWMPTLNAPAGAPSMARRNFAMDWANTMGTDIQNMPGMEQIVQQYVAGNSPALQQLQRQYVQDLYSRGGGWNPNLVTAQAPIGMPTANQYLSNLGWGLNNRQVAGETYNPATNAFAPTAQMQYANFGQVGPTAIENAGGTNQFLEMAKQAAINTLQRAASSKPNSNSSFGLGGIDKLKSDVNQASAQTPQWTAKDNADVESLKMTAQKMNYPTFVNYLQQQPISDYVKQALEGWAKKFYNVK